jgi:SAM-dependent methyltransferase
MGGCRICRSADTEIVLDLGLQPVSSHFGLAPGGPAVRHPLALGVCRSCGTVQLAQPFPYADLIPPFDWITYREPEGHLDAATAAIRALPGLPANARVAGLSFKDNTTLDRLRDLGLTRTWSLDPARDLGANGGGVETVQAMLTPQRADEIVARHGPFDLVIARHVLEHAEDPSRFLGSLGILLAPGGYLMLEVPECGANLVRQDYAMIWEEHALYFTPQTFPQVLALAGCALVSQQVYPYPFEDVIITVGRKAAEGGAVARAPDEESVAGVVEGARAFGAAFSDHSARYRKLLTKWTQDGRKLAAYGAGHLSCAFINFHALADLFAIVVDDTPQKQGLFLPGSDLPVVPRSRLNAAQTAVCLFGIGPQTEDKIVAANKSYLDASGRFGSMLADSDRSIRHLNENSERSALS